MEKLLEIKDLKINFNTEEGIVRAVRGASIRIDKNIIHGLVGESGCGKSVTARSVLNILAANAEIIGGETLYHHQGEIVDLSKLHPDGKEVRKFRWRDISMIFQEPMTSFSPVHTIGNQLMEAILLHSDLSQVAARTHAINMLERVGIPDPAKRIDEYPHQLSGGMRQRAMIAMALSGNPKLLIADEPTTALDVTIQAQIIELMKQMKDELGMSIMIITHDMGVIAEMADYVSVMYLGKVVESAPVVELFYNPLHPYTKALLKSIPTINSKREEKLTAIAGTVPDAYCIPGGCAFYPRCSQYKPGGCDRSEPKLVEVATDHQVACIMYHGEVETDGGE